MTTLSPSEYRAMGGKKPIVKESAIHKTVVAHEEHLRPVEGFEGYFISSIGRVFSTIKRGGGGFRELKAEAGNKGHLRVTLFCKGGKKRILVHRLVLRAFVGAPPTPQHVGCHKDDDASNNCVDNLYWGTRSDNKRDADLSGRSYVGERNHFSTIKEADVVAITAAVVGGKSIDEVAKEFNLCRTAIVRIATGKSWAHVQRVTLPTCFREKSDPEKISAALQMVRDGSSLNHAAANFGVSRKTLARLSKPPVIKEKHIHDAVIRHWKAFGVDGTLVATLANERAFGQPGLTKGLPDLILIGPKVHGYLELKTETGKLSGPQREFQSLCMERGIPFFVTHGVDEPIRLLEALEIVRPDRGVISIGEAAARVIDRLREERR